LFTITITTTTTTTTITITTTQPTEREVAARELRATYGICEPEPEPEREPVLKPIPQAAIDPYASPQQQQAAAQLAFLQQNFESETADTKDDASCTTFTSGDFFNSLAHDSTTVLTEIGSDGFSINGENDTVASTHTLVTNLSKNSQTSVIWVQKLARLKRNETEKAKAEAEDGTTKKKSNKRVTERDFNFLSSEHSKNFWRMLGTQRAEYIKVMRNTRRTALKAIYCITAPYEEGRVQQMVMMRQEMVDNLTEL
jgi:hypothetical protein